MKPTEAVQKMAIEANADNIQYIKAPTKAVKAMHAEKVRLRKEAAAKQRTEKLQAKLDRKQKC